MRELCVVGLGSLKPKGMPRLTLLFSLHPAKHTLKVKKLEDRAPHKADKQGAAAATKTPQYGGNLQKWVTIKCAPHVPHATGP